MHWGCLLVVINIHAGILLRRGGLNFNLVIISMVVAVNDNKMNTIGTLVASMSLKEKASLCSGQNLWETQAIPRLAIPSILMTDGPHGLRKQAGDLGEVNIKGVAATCFPTASALANSWDCELLSAIGEALGRECLEEQVSVLLGPGVNIKRSPLCGRNFEYFSEDPLLSGELAAHWILGVQAKGIGASLKHFAVNNQEYRRMVIDAKVDMRTIREIYLPGFEIAVTKAQPWTVMAAYNRVNGKFCCENEWLLNDVLRREWGFLGLVVSDWGGCNDRVAGLAAGLDLEMPSSSGLNDQRIVSAVTDGTLSPTIVDQAVRRILTLVEGSIRNRTDYLGYNRAQHHALACTAAAESTVLLKNDGPLLPLRPDAKVALIGDFAKTPRYQGAGSSQINPHRVDCAFEALSGRIDFEYVPGFLRNGSQPDATLIAEACQLAQRCDIAIIFAGLPEIYESEGMDRDSLNLPASQNALIEQVAASNARTIVVLSAGAPIEMPWLDRVPAVVAAYLGGQGGGSAIADILLGVFNPGGKLAESWPVSLKQTPTHNNFPGGPHRVEYREGIFVGYRYYDSLQIPVAFPFGHGLSYTRFEYGRAKVSRSLLDVNEPLTVSISVKNIGAVAGAEIVQIYVQPAKAAVLRPVKELKAFCKIRLEPGEEKLALSTLERRAFAYFDVADDKWRVASGEYQILFGSSSTDIRGSVSVYVLGDKPVLGGDPEPDFSQVKRDLSCAAAMDFCPADITADSSGFPQGYHLNSLLGEIRSTLIGRLLHEVAYRSAQAMAKRSDDPVIAKMLERAISEMPLRQLVAFSGGRLTFETMDVLLAFMNGRWLMGFRLLFK